MKPETTNKDTNPVNVPAEIAKDPEAKDLYIKGYSVMKKDPALRKLSASKRIFWIYGFINGNLYERQVKKEKKDEE